VVNTEHRHSGLGLLTPADVHHGLAEQRVATRATVLAAAYAAHPERFPAGLPQPLAYPKEVWINPPRPGSSESPLTGGPALSYAVTSSISSRRTACPFTSPPVPGPQISFCPAWPAQGAQWRRNGGSHEP
jgi:hypothetical protein